MKTLKTVSVALLLTLCVAGASAQQRKAQKVKERQSAEKIAEVRTDKMDQRLELTDAQESKIYNLTLQFAQAAESNKRAKADEKSKRPSREQMKAIAAKRAETKKQYDTEVMDILNDEQKVEYAYMLKSEGAKVRAHAKQGSKKGQRQGKSCKSCPNAKASK